MAGSRHSEADMQIIRTARKAAQDLVNHMVALGDDGMPDSPPINSMVPSTPQPMKAVKATTADLATQVCTVLAGTVFLQYKTHAAHWNVEGEDFPQYHAFFEQVYEALGDAVDAIAETLRTLDYKAPATLFALAIHQPLDTTTADASLDALIASISVDNMRIIDVLNGGVIMAGEVAEFGVQNFLQDRLMYHQKLRWQLRAIMMAEPDEMNPMELAETPAQEVAEPVDMQMYEYEPDGMAAIRATADRNATPKEREAMPAGDFVIPDTRNFPIITPDDVPAAVSTWGRYKGDVTFEQFKSDLIALAKRKGPDFVAALPKEWRDEMAKSVQDFARKLIGIMQ
ncbi:DNA-binding protein Dps [uncultured Caudovirales phage]|uniref:DNA-binding protein Dps n=1 Tax=uncultured Caudovirales phage TaxID=2100421 RepID=A0A6J7WLL1_9CAUD|nr:DNA-binding protein Dps [uncultured Caudovirales phage]CAB5218637.1 DNA-binding protein Dps [uncultured Caudovirales phage]